MSEPRPQRPWIEWIGLIALVLIVFGRMLPYGPVNWDDRDTIFFNPLHRPVSIESFIAAWDRPLLSLWIPVTHSVWAALALVAGAWKEPADATFPAWPFRVASLAMHAAATVLTFEIVRRLVASPRLVAFLAAALFAVHPLQVESVAWISGQKDLIAGALTLLAMMLALRAPADRVGVAVVVAAVAAMLAKPQAIVVVALVPIIARTAGASWQTARRYVCWLAGPAVVVAIVAKSVQPAPYVADVGLLWRPAVALDALTFYLGKIVWPMPTALDYGRSPSTVTGLRLMIAVVALAAVAWIAWRSRSTRPTIGIGLAIATIAVLPVSGLMPFEFQQYSTVADHYVYTAMAGIALVAAGAMSGRRMLLSGVVGGLAVVLLAVLSFRQVGVWRETQTLFQHTLRVNPTSLAALRVLAAERSARGDDLTAIELLRATLAAHPRDAIASYNLGNALARQGDLPAALAAYRQAVASRPAHVGIRHNYGVALVQAGYLGSAEAQFAAAIELNPRADASRRALERVRAMRASTRPAVP